VLVKSLNTRKKIGASGLLMILSLTLLTGFAVYWLHSQYTGEKAQLTIALTRELQGAQEVVVDSLLLSVFIEPVLSDSVTLTLRPGEMTQKKETKLKADIEIDSVPGGNMRIIEHIVTDTMETNGEFIWHNNDLLIRSFRLMMSKTDGNMVTDSVQVIAIRDPEMQQLLKEVFSEKLQESGYLFTTTWISDSADRPGNKFDRLVLAEGSSFSSGYVILKGTGIYLLVRTLPQLLFVVLLLGITGTAFMLMNRSMRKQFELNRIRKDLISNMTHELKTPVSTMKVALEALDFYGGRQDPKKTTEYLEIASEEVDRLDSLIVRMLDHVVLEEYSEEFELVPTDLSVMAHEVTRLYTVKAETSGGSISIEQNATQPVISAEPFYLQMAIMNVVDNSFKYAGAHPEIVIRLSDLPGMRLKLEINDNGPGIPAAYSGKVFDKFFRIPGGDVHDVKGHGLGLSLVAMVVRMHHGIVRQENLAEGGCSFIFEFSTIPGND